jgi:hypothetical protein
MRRPRRSRLREGRTANRLAPQHQFGGWRLAGSGAGKKIRYAEKKMAAAPPGGRRIESLIPDSHHELFL